MAQKLTDTEIASRMVELRNLRRLHTESRKREVLKDVRIQELETIVLDQQKTNETLKIQIAELQTMVFGKKKRPPMGGTPIMPSLFIPSPKKRTKASYRRPLPPASAITAELVVALPGHCQCGGKLANITTHERYQEDIPLPELTLNYQAKLVTK